jgi:hypothetical protein
MMAKRAKNNDCNKKISQSEAFNFFCRLNKLSNNRNEKTFCAKNVQTFYLIYDLKI